MDQRTGRQLIFSRGAGVGGGVKSQLHAFFFFFLKSKSSRQMKNIIVSLDLSRRIAFSCGNCLLSSPPPPLIGARGPASANNYN